MTESCGRSCTQRRVGTTSCLSFAMPAHARSAAWNLSGRSRHLLPTAKSETYDFGGPSHEFFLWHDPTNSNRVVAYMAMFAGGGLPDPENPSLRIPDAIALAVTDEETGAMLMRPKVLAAFSLQEVGGPPVTETPDPTGYSPTAVSPILAS